MAEKDGQLNNNHDLIQTMELPMVDVSILTQDSNEKSIVIKQIQEACQTWGAFQVISLALEYYSLVGCTYPDKSKSAKQRRHLLSLFFFIKCSTF